MRTSRYSQNTPGFRDRNTHSRADRGPFPSAAMIVEAYGKLSSGVEGRLTRANVAYSISLPSGINTAIISISSLSQGDTAIMAALDIVVLRKIDM